MTHGHPNSQPPPQTQGHVVAVQPSGMARRLFWHLYSLADVRINAPETHESFEKPGAHLFWITSGRGVLELPSGTFALEKGPNAWFVDMKKPRKYIPRGNTMLGIRGIRFGGPVLDSWHEVLGGNRQPEFVFQAPAFLHQSYRQLLLLVRKRPGQWEWEAHHILHQLMGRLLEARGLLGVMAAELPAPMVRVFNAVDADPTRYWRAHELPGIAHVSYSKLRTLFFQNRGETIHQYLQRFRLDQSRRLLADERLSVKEVAERLHFPNEFYFSRFFHRCTGTTPTQFRSVARARTPGKV